MPQSPCIVGLRLTAAHRELADELGLHRDVEINHQRKQSLGDVLPSHQ